MTMGIKMLPVPTETESPDCSLLVKRKPKLSSYKDTHRQSWQDLSAVSIKLDKCTQARQGKARQGKARQGKARQARQGKARQGKARQGKARQGKARQARQGKGTARQGTARQGKARQGSAQRLMCKALRKACAGIIACDITRMATHASA